MKASVHILAAMACLTGAQKMSDALPACAADCLNSGIESATNCALDDGDCICEVDNYRNTYDSATACVLQACGAAKSLDEVLPAAAKFCSEVTDGATAPPVDESAPSTKTSAATSTTSGASHTNGQTPAATEDVKSSEPSGTDEPDAALSLGSMNIFGMIALGLAAIF